MEQTPDGAAATPPAQPAQPTGVTPPAAGTTPPAVPGQQPIIINVGNQGPAPAPVVVRPGHPFLRRVAVGGAIIVAGTIGLGIVGHEVTSGSGGYTPGPVITAPAPTSPTPAPPLSHVPPKIETHAYISVVHTGDQNYIDLTVTVINNGDQPVQDVVVYLEQMQNGKPVAVQIHDAGGWYGITNGAQMPGTLGIGETMPVTLEITQWIPNEPISIVVGGNGVANDSSMARVACPTNDGAPPAQCELGG